MGYITEAFVFSYLGLTFFSYSSYNWSLDLFCLQLVSLLVSRFFGTILLVKFLKATGKNIDIHWKEMVFIWYAGLIRGAIAFGLVLQIKESVSPNREVIVTTTISLVVFTTIIFGSTVPLLS
jgi:sodium/hydrogen exchanger-like protein 6/7/sodium/hydrogen exchanger 8